MVRLSTRGVTLIELMFVCGLFAIVLTILAVSLRQTVASQKQLDQGAGVLVSLELTRLKLSALLRRSELGDSMDFGTPSDRLTLRLHEMDSPGKPKLDALGAPIQGGLAVVMMEDEGRLVLREAAAATLVSRLGEDATFEVTRISENRFRFRLTADDGLGEPRELVFLSGF